MLAEFALTPSVFDEQAHPDGELWREQLRTLGANMFPQVAAWPIMIADLHAGSWHHAVRDLVLSVKDQRARILCQGILANAERTMVPRPAYSDWPEDELGWSREAIQASSVEPIDRIVATSAAHGTLGGQCWSTRSLNEVHDAGFWHGVSADASPPMNISEQVAALRKLCVHSQFLCLITPHIYGGGDDETDFAVELIRSTYNRPVGFAAAEVEIHTEAPGGDPSLADFTERLCRREAAVTQRLKTVLAHGQQVKLFFWPKLLDRLIVAGVYARVAPGQQKRSPRWAVSMSHIARKGDESKPDFFTVWTLLKRDSLGRWFDRYCREGVKGYLKSTMMTG